MFFREKKKCFYVLPIAIGSLFLMAFTDANEQIEPSLTIEKYNLSYSSETYIAYAVSYNGFNPEENEIKMLFWNDYDESGEYSKGTEDYVAYAKGSTTINEKEYEVFYSNGIAPKELTDYIYCRAYVTIDDKDYFSKPIKYSALTYLHNQLDKDDLTTTDRTLFNALLSYGAAAQIKFNYKTDTLATDTYYSFNAVNAILDDGFTYGLYKEGQSFVVKSDIPDGEGGFSYWKDEQQNNIGNDDPLNYQMPAKDTTLTAVYGECLNGVHQYEESIVEPNGERRGYTVHTCRICGDYYYSDYDFSLYSGIQFNAANKRLIPYSFNAKNYTIELSFNLPKNYSSRGGVLVGNYGSGDGFNLEIYNNGKPRLYFLSDSTAYDYVFSTDIRSDGIVNLAITFSEKDSAKLYIDGVFKEEKQLDDFSIKTIGRKLCVGGDYRSSNSQFFKGTLYSVSVFNDIRTESELMEDLIIADSTDAHCCVSYNIIDENAFNQQSSSDLSFEYAEVDNADELEYQASIGTKMINVTSDFFIDKTIFVVGNVTIYSDNGATITRNGSFPGDIFVVGENSSGRNLILEDLDSNLTLGKENANGTLTIDGNKQYVKVDVYGTLVYIDNSGTLTINDNASLVNNKKTSNSRAYSLGKAIGAKIGGAAIININGLVTINGGTISGNDVNTIDITEGDTTSDDYLLSSYGGAIFNYSNVVMNGGTISNNTAYYGGAISNYLISHIYGGLFENNVTSHAGGAIYNYNSSQTNLYIGLEGNDFDTVVFRNNSTTTSSGGAVYSGSVCNIMIEDGVTFESNHTKGSGGALYIGGYGSVQGKIKFNLNSADNSGGALYLIYGADAENPSSTRRTTTLDSVSFTNNTAKYGGAISSMGSDTSINNCTFENNSTTTSGGAIVTNKTSFGTGAMVTITNSIIQSNSSVEGGALLLDALSNVAITSTDILNNTSSGKGGAISTHGCSSLTITECDVSNNQSEDNGGAIYVSYRTDNTDPDNPVIYESYVNISNSVLNGNISQAAGGAIYAIAKDPLSNVLKVSDCTLSNNDASNEGGAVVITSATASIIGTTFNSNSSSKNGGAIYVSGNSNLTCTSIVGTCNNAVGNGGFMYVTNSTVSINGTSVIGDLNDSSKGNTAVGGAGIYASSNSNIVLSGVNFGYNTSTGSGGAIYIYQSASFTAENCIIEHNSANYGGAVIVYGAEATFEHCSFSNNTASSWGGAFYIREGAGDNPFSSLISVITCSFDNNTSNYGGAIYLNTNCRLSISNSTFSNNSALSGGAIFNSSGNSFIINGSVFNGNISTEAEGGAIVVKNSSLTVNNTEFTNNTAATNGGAIYANGSTINGDNNTFTGNTANSDTYGGGAIYSTHSTITISNSTFTGNTARNGGAVAGYTNSNIYLTNIIAESNTATSAGGFAYINISYINIQSDNGDCIIGSANDSSKGNSAPGGGAIYLDSNSTGIITNVVFGYNNATSSGGAIYCKHSTATITGTSLVHNTAKYGGAVMVYGADVNISSSVLSNNESTSGFGGAIYARQGDEEISLTSMVTIDGSTFQENNSQGSGGAIYLNTNSSANISNTSFISNTAVDGGAIYSVSNLTIENCTFTTNVAEKDGGALYLSGSTCNFVSGTLHGNSAGANGGAIALYSSSEMNIDSMVATGNTANLGGVFYINRSELNIIAESDGVIVFGTEDANQAGSLGNSATSKGGVIYSTIGGNVTIDGATFGYNSSANGGAIAGSHASGCTVNIANSSFVGNSASSNGGAVFGEGASSFVIQNCTFTNNTAKCGAAIYGNANSVFDISDCEFISNTSTGSGGAVAIYASSKMTISNCDFISNSAATTGGAIQAYSDGTQTTVLENCLFRDNTAGTNGGAIYQSSATVMTIRGVTLKDNSATGLGDGIYATNGSSLSTSLTIYSITIDQVGGDPIYVAQKTAKVYIYISGVTDANNPAVDFSTIVKGASESVINGAVTYYEGE